MFVRVNAIFNTWGVILHEGRIDGLNSKPSSQLRELSTEVLK